ncbi:hypothetical protein D8M06_11315 [Oceanobacillus halophilus]|uniref:Uncharacterized protein n=1 Tax=Oceanobacillus halophilus TaxID=930130 RepID=A0A495A222_9BACI|nr:hypothetical protein D8M06_11315 [Oceanobacillus halophilus]
MNSVNERYTLLTFYPHVENLEPFDKNTIIHIITSIITFITVFFIKNKYNIELPLGGFFYEIYYPT